MHSMWQRKNKKEPPASPDIEITSTDTKEHDKISLFLDEIHTTDTPTPNTTPEPFEKYNQSKKPFHNLRKKPHGTPIYLQDNGNQIATVLEEIQDIKNKIHLLTIQDIETKNIYQIPATHFDQHSDGIIYIPTWYTKGKKIINHLQFNDRINPEFKLLINEETTNPQDLYETFIHNDPELQQQLHQTQTTHKILNTRLTLLKKERTTIKQHIFDLIEQRLIKDIPRKQFAETIQEHRNKATLLDLQITRCTQLLKQLNQTSLGQYIQKTKPPEEEKNKTSDQIQLQQKYQQLQQNYQELKDKHTRLKDSIEKLLNKELI